MSDTVLLPLEDPSRKECFLHIEQVYQQFLTRIGSLIHGLYFTR